jgi:hypothetical protein
MLCHLSIARVSVAFGFRCFRDLLKALRRFHCQASFAVSSHLCEQFVLSEEAFLLLFGSVRFFISLRVRVRVCVRGCFVFCFRISRKSYSMSITLFGTAGSTCTSRVLTTLFEKQVQDFVLKHVDLAKGEQKKPEFLKLQVSS